MDSKIEFSFNELNALNKLLRQIKTESYLTADEINFFALSPFIISSCEKIHKEFMNRFREQVSTGKIKMSEPQGIFDSKDDFLLTDKSYIGDQEKRLRDLGQQNKEYIKKMDSIKREEYADLVFAPFKPTENQRKKVMDVLESMTRQ
jgi:hypothetical protein